MTPNTKGTGFEQYITDYLVSENGCVAICQGLSEMEIGIMNFAEILELSIN